LLAASAARAGNSPKKRCVEALCNNYANSRGNFVITKSKTLPILGGLLAAAIACAVPVTSAMAAATSGNVAGWVKNATLIGAAPDNMQVTIAVHMNLSNTAALKTLAAQVSNPSSASYGHYLSREQFGARFAPAAADVEAVRAGMEHVGMTNVTVGPFGTYVSATATVRQLSTVLHITQNLYSYKGLTMRANREEPTIPASMAGKIAFIAGLDDSTLMRTPQFHSARMGKLVTPATAATAAPDAPTPPPIAAGNPPEFCNNDYGDGVLVANLSTAADVYGSSIPWLNCGYTPQQMRTAYGVNKVGSTGKGVTVAILDAFASPTLFADGNRYSANHGLPALRRGHNFRQIVPLGIYHVDPNDPCGPQGWWTEQSLDVDAVHGMAPGANIVYVGSMDCGPSLDMALMNTVYNHVADVVTNSWGFNGEAIAPGQAAAEDQAFMAGAVQGMTVLFSSGDDGDLSAPNGVASGGWPATSAWVTGVGGTTLMVMGDSGAKAEYGWGTYRAYTTDTMVNSATDITDSGVAQTEAFGIGYDDFSFYSGAGGGISLLEPQPLYQAGAVSPVLATSLNLASGYTETLPSAQRMSPDIAMDADPYTGYLFGQTFTIAGDPISDFGCTPISATEEYCENGIGGTSLSSPLMAGVIAIMNQHRHAYGQPAVGFANPLLYSVGSRGDGVTFNEPINQIVAPTTPVALLRGYASDPTRLRIITVNSVPFNISTAPYAILTCGLEICLGVNDVFNYTSMAPDGIPPTGPGYNDVTGLGVPYVPELILAH
jgi:subtilase family serine protease